jgi:putative addiction module component (TIGR02574 family)
MTTAHTEIESEVLKWSPAERVNLAERLLESVDNFASEDVDRAWRTEIARRVGEAESGKESGISSRAVFAEARQQLNEIRQVSPARARRTRRVP